MVVAQMAEVEAEATLEVGAMAAGKAAGVGRLATVEAESAM